MDFTQYIPDFIINFFAGIAGILLVLWIERQRRPQLSMTVDSPGTIDEIDPLKRPTCTFLHVKVSNRSTPRWISWVYDGEPALSCSAWVSYYHLDGQPVFSKEMTARWAETPEPQVQTFDVGGKTAARIVGFQNTVDIPPGESTQVDVSSRINGDSKCYGWTNESYLHGWRHPEWELGPNRYIARIRVKTGGREFTEDFLVINDVPFSDFRLEPVPEIYKNKVN